MTTTLTELRTAQNLARISHKKAILRADVPGVVATLNYLRALEAAYEAAVDAEGPIASMHHDNSYDRHDLGHGFHVIESAGSYSGVSRSRG